MDLLLQIKSVIKGNSVIPFPETWEASNKAAISPSALKISPTKFCPSKVKKFEVINQN